VGRHKCKCGRPGMTIKQLRETEKLVRQQGHHAAAKELDIGYHAVRYRMRRLKTLRGEVPTYSRGKRCPKGEI
jgi:hypothetical protein